MQQACWLSCTGLYATGAYHALPSWEGYKISRGAFLERMRMTLYLPIPGADALPRRCTVRGCGADMDSRGYHVYYCFHSGGSSVRHNLIRDLTYEIARTCGCSSVRREIPLRPAQFYDARRLDVKADDLFIDTTVVSPMIAMNRRHGGFSRNSPAARSQGAAAREATRRKHRHYPAQDLPPGKILVAAAMEVFGHMGAEFVQLLAHFAAKAQAVRGWPAWFFWHKFAPKFGACLAEGNYLKANFMRDFYVRHRPDAGDAGDADGQAANEPELDLEGPALSSRRRGHVRVPSASPFGQRVAGRRPPVAASGGRRAHGGGRRSAHGRTRRGAGGSAARRPLTSRRGAPAA